jgi:chemotaxis signal transduction protein
LLIRLTTITTLPQMPDYMHGVINLRGRIIPVTDVARNGSAENRKSG